MGHGRGKKRKMKKLERECIPDNIQELEENIDNVEYYGIDQSDTGSQV